jgi:hypothetical protein
VIVVAFGGAKAAEEYKLDGSGSKLLEKAGKVLDMFIDEQENR